MSATAASGVEVVAVAMPALGDRSYLEHDGEVALVVDPQRDIDRVLALAAAWGVPRSPGEEPSAGRGPPRAALCP